jgi:NTP pyrophosphatase (non-canonical NTP hydrolase)
MDKLLTFAELTGANKLRCERDFAEPLNDSSSYTPADWALSVVEEIGEVAAAVLGATGKKRRKAHLTMADVGDEIADAVIYLDLLATRIGFDLGYLVWKKFNAVSERIGSAVKLGDIQTCEPWCFAIGWRDGWHGAHPCSDKCRDAGRPLNPSDHKDKL